jgi:hypothetical protein
VERPEPGHQPGHAGVGPPRTNDIDLDERRKTLTPGGEGEETADARPRDRLLESR